jgi:hypothetical protein
MAAAKDQEPASVTVVGSDGTEVEMVVIGDVRYRADDPVITKLRKQAADKSRSSSATK